MLDAELLKILACPFCKSDIRLEGQTIFCTNKDCACQYEVKDDIPVMLIDQAKRPCPKCNTQRDWVEDKDLIICPKCQTKIEYKPDQAVQSVQPK